MEKARWMAVHPEPWSVDVEKEYHERFSVRMDRWMDEGHGECLLRNPEAAEIVEEALTNLKNCKHYAWVIMPNHVHAVFSLLGECRLEMALQRLKGASSRRLNLFFGREGAFWQKDYFDRMVRDEKHFANIIGYIRRNPAKARLWDGEYLLWESDKEWRL